MFKFMITLALLLSLQTLPAELYAQVEIPFMDDPTTPAFYLDVATFRSNKPGFTSIEVYVKFYNSQIHFRKSGGVFKASVEISAMLFGPGGLYFAGGSWEDSLKVDDYDKTNSSSDFRVESCSLLAPPGGYILSVKLTDMETGKGSEISRKLEVPDYDCAGISISDIELCSEIVPDTPAGNFVKHGYKVVPIVQREYGDAISRVWFYFELYGQDGDRADLRYEVRDENGDTILSGNLEDDGTSRGLRGGGTFHISSLDVKGLEEGKYTLEVTATMPDGRSVSRSNDFSIRWFYY